MVEAYLFFHDCLSEFFGDASRKSTWQTQTLEDALDKCFQALRSVLLVVVIDLEQGDDAQVIFETLNARGEPLLPADRVNYIFLRAARSGASQEQLYEAHWRPFDDAFWRHEVQQGRLSLSSERPLLEHFLSSRKMVDIPIKHLFVEYKSWIEPRSGAAPFATIDAGVIGFRKRGICFGRFLSRSLPTRSLRCLSFSTHSTSERPIRCCSPSWRRISAPQSGRASRTLSNPICFVARSAGLTTKNYNRVFLGRPGFCATTA